MKTLPITIVGPGKLDKTNALLAESLRRNREKIDRLVLIQPSNPRPRIEELITEKYSIDFSEKIKQFSKEIFGK